MGLRVLFIEIDTEASWAVASFGPAFMAPMLRKVGHPTGLIRHKVADTPADLVERVRRLKPDLIGLSLTTRQWQRAREVAAALGAEGLGPIVAGGLHPTFSPQEVLETPGITYVCIGEGEEPMLDLCRALDLGEPVIGIDNIWAPGGLKPKMRPPIEELDSMPFMARDMLDERHGVAHISTQRGCPFPCTYCAARMFGELYGGDVAGRRRSHEDVFAELRELKAKRKLNYVIFLDDTFTINHKWVRDFLTKYRDEFRVPFSLNARVETVRPEMLKLLKSAGCQHIIYGVESGSYRVRKDIMKRPVRNERFKEVFEWTREAGIMMTANYMLGVPGETTDDIEQTLSLAEELGAFDFGYFVFYPFPGTQLFRVCRDEGYLPEDYLDREANHRESILDLPDLTNEQIGYYYDQFTALKARMHLKRQGPNASVAVKKRIMEQVRRMAHSG